MDGSYVISLGSERRRVCTPLKWFGSENRKFGNDKVWFGLGEDLVWREEDLVKIR